MQQTSYEPLAIDRSNVEIVASDPSSSDATCMISEEPMLIIGDNEEDDTQWFSFIRGMGRLSDGSVVAIDRAAAEVRVFDNTGRYLRSMGRRGEGPGEFLDPFILWITPGDTLWVGDYHPWRYNVFTADGEFVRRMNLSPEYLNPSRGGGVLDNGYTVNARYTLPRETDFSVPESLIVEVHDPSGKLIGGLPSMPGRRLGQIRGGRPNFWQSQLFAASAVVDALGSIIALAHGSKPEVQVLDHNLNLQMIIRWNESPRAVTAADVRTWRENYKARQAESSGDWDQYDDTYISPDRPVADAFPVMSSIKIGRDGRIWIPQIPPPDEEREWLAVGADGRFVCHMAEPPSEVWEFGADYVLLESQEGAPMVQMHQLTTPS